MWISCSCYDQLEIAAMRQQQVCFVFRIHKAKSTSVVGIIENIFTSKGKEYVSIKNGGTFCLDLLLTIEVVN